MPYSQNSALPPAIRNGLPDAAQTIYRKAFNQAIKGKGGKPTGDDAKAAKYAWTAVKHAGYKKVSGAWKKTDGVSKAGLGVGSFVTWENGKATGKIVGVVKNGDVKDISGSNKITGTADAPAARVRVYKDGKATDTYVGHKIDGLTPWKGAVSKAGGHKPTGAMVTAAKKAKQWKADGKGGLTSKGVHIMNAIISGSLSDQDVTDGYSFMSRALEGEKGDGYDSKSDKYPNKKRVSIEAWGGEGSLKAFWEPKRNKISKRGGDATEADERVVGKIAKLDEDEMRAFGWAQVSISKGMTDPLFDRQGDSIHVDELAKGVYKYVRNSRKAGIMHARVSKSDDDTEPVHAGDLIESIVFTDEKIEKMGLPEDFPRAWWIGFDVDPAVWPSVKDGTLPMFSVHGAGLRKRID